MRALAPGSRFAGYRIERLIGRGGMGTVYLARGSRAPGPVALKVVRAEMAVDDVFRRRFEREARLTLELDHPHVVPVYDAGESGGSLFMATRYIDGPDLEAVVLDQGALHPIHAAEVVAGIGSALDVAHKRGLVHRDVKPANILLERRDAGVHPYLSDFGLSKLVESTSGLTRTGTWVGTIDYAAPEQLQSQPVDGRTDVYALGCVLYQALTARVPYSQTRDVDKLLAHLSAPPPAVGPGIPGGFDEVIARAMAKDPGDRYASAGELARAALDAASLASPPAEPLLVREPRPAQGIDRGAPTAG